MLAIISIIPIPRPMPLNHTSRDRFKENLLRGFIDEAVGDSIALSISKSPLLISVIQSLL